ncbi:MAG TPA: translation initiation factor IF-2 [Halanaerobiales bacterium]|nr:translation initiation factor IF-2 [Halanaerobiales bacterium]HPZ62573.1 translation initiation factor IF-2 [Halanaerobiales bacterium]HQD03131.1 translation initiation factor IF-2 [Halanaerobiales bacterium]
MAKVRVYQLAKEMDISSSELLDILHDLDVDVSSHMSSINAETAELVKGMFADSKEEDTEVKKEKAVKSGKKEEQVAKEKDKEKERKKEPKKESKKEGKKEKAKAKAKAGRAKRDEGSKKDAKALEIEAPLTVKEYADLVKKSGNEIIKTLMGLGLMANLNYSLDEDTLIMLSDELGLEVEIKDRAQEGNNEIEELLYGPVGPEIVDSEEDLELRPPIVTVMGHVDHGKTSLLDYIRKVRVVEREAGGITQHIGAYQTTINDKKITFIDTPGHEAFTAMRARGAQVTDIAILVVAADDGVMPQTVEAINHAKAANIPIIVAINKIDRPAAQPDMVKQQLAEHGLLTEDWGGDTICVPISALKGENIDDLLEMVLLVAELEELKANPNRPAEGVIIESKLDKGRGPVATVLIKNGSMNVGDPILAGPVCGRVRAMFDDKGKQVKKATPSMPVEVLGFSDVPNAGDFVQVLEDEKEARQIAERRRQYIQEKTLNVDSRVSLEDLYQQIQQGEVKELNVIIKADVHGSIEALRDSFQKLGNEEVSVKIIHTGVGAINETDVNLANASNAVIIGFNVRPDANARRIAEEENVDIRTYRVIYQAIEELKDAMSGLLAPELKEEVTGRAEVRDTFRIPGVGVVAGLYVTEGIINRNSQVRLLRDGVVIYEGNIASLKRFENDVREVKEGFECGLGIEGYNDIKIGDELEIYIIKKIKRSL